MEIMTSGRRWYDEVEEITARLVRINSISPNVAGENACAAEIRCALRERGVHSATWEMRADGREIVWAMVEGGAMSPQAQRIPTIVLMGHLDTAGVQDYSRDLDPFDPEGLRQALVEQYQAQPDTADERLQDAASGDWMFGRGSFDMKSGVAAQIAVMGALEKSKESLPGNVLMITTPDEEVESGGIMDALRPLLHLRDARSLDIVGAINSDYAAPRGPGDDRRYIYHGTIGKLLCCFYVRGCETHVGEAFRGLDANLISANLICRTNLNVDLCDEADGEITVPPVTQKARDFKARYDAQTPISAVVHCSCLVHSWTPEQVLNKMVALAQQALGDANRRRLRQWQVYAARQGNPRSLPDLGGRVWTYQQLYEAVEDKLGPAELSQELEARALGYVRQARRVLSRLTPAEQDFLVDNGQLVGIDSRERSLVIVRTLVDIATREEIFSSGQPAIVVYFAPPFFPPVRGDETSPLSRAITDQVNARHRALIQFRSFYPYVSEMSYVRVDDDVYKSLPALKANFPLWRDPDVETPEDSRTEYFTVPFDLIRELGCDVVNIGPWGKEAHGKGERVYTPYSFETVPELIHAVIVSLLGESTEPPL
ncbi:MAG: M20/M25/M40 family metallo-hydrolase [Chloroflexota bacterium]